jgi:HD-GYP domain-containing protein (c-di-GMP phosphodiesterase class II)
MNAFEETSPGKEIAIQDTGPVSQTEWWRSKPHEVSEDRLSKSGNLLVIKFHVLMKTARIYDPNNETLHHFIQEFLQIINPLILRYRTVSLKIIRDDLYLNEQRLRWLVEGFTSFKFLLAELKSRCIGEIIFRMALNERILIEFTHLLSSLEPGHEDNASRLKDQLMKQGISIIDLHPSQVFEGEEEGMFFHGEDHREAGKKLYFETIGAVKEVITNIQGDQYANLRKLKRLTQKAVRLVIEDESILMGLATIKNYDEYTFNHSVNVAIYALGIGRRLGFTKGTMMELGMAALLHDVGKARIPREILNKPSQLDEGEWDVMKKNPVLGAEIALGLKQLSEISPRIAIGIFDHQLKNDLSGYPKLFRKKKISLFGRIIKIANAYDAMTTPKNYKLVPYTPGQTLAVMLKDQGIDFDPVLLKIFIGLVGIYPIGSLLLLDTREVGIVFKANPEPKFLGRPLIILIKLDGTLAAKKQLVDLTEMNKEGMFSRNIVKTLDPHQHRIEISKYFL